MSWKSLRAEREHTRAVECLERIWERLIKMDVTYIEAATIGQIEGLIWELGIHTKSLEDAIRPDLDPCRSTSDAAAFQGD